MLCDSAYKLNSKDLVRFKWHDLYLPKSNKKIRPNNTGFLSFWWWTYLNENNIDFFPKTIPYSYEINVIGLRNLKPLSMFLLKNLLINLIWIL